MPSQLTVPDMSALPTLLPGRESTTSVPAGQRILVALPDPSRTSLVISSSGTGALTLSTKATGSMAEGLQFPSGLGGPLLITWDLYGSKVQDAWYAGNPAAAAIDVTVIEVMTRPNAAPTPARRSKSSTPLADCIKRRTPPVFDPPPIFDNPTVVVPCCANPISTTLTCTVTMKTGGFAGLPNSIPFNWVAITSSWNALNVVAGCPNDGQTLILTCGGGLLWNLDCTGLSFNVNETSSNCNPFGVVFDAIGFCGFIPGTARFTFT